MIFQFFGGIQKYIPFMILVEKNITKSLDRPGLMVV